MSAHILIQLSEQERTQLETAMSGQLYQFQKIYEVNSDRLNQQTGQAISLDAMNTLSTLIING